MRGRASKSFHPFLLAGVGTGIKACLEDLKDKVMIDFNPVRCFIDEIEVRISQWW